MMQARSAYVRCGRWAVGLPTHIHLEETQGFIEAYGAHKALRGYA